MQDHYFAEVPESTVAADFKAARRREAAVRDGESDSASDPEVKAQ
jgi:hypothetical protein